MKKTLVSTTIVAAAIATVSFSAVADTVKISGASTVFNVVVSPAKAAVEKSTGHTLQLVSSGTGKGLG